MEKEELEETNGASPPYVGKPKGDGFLVQDEDLEKQSKGVEGLNDDAKLLDEEDDVLENKISSHAVEKVEVDSSNIQNEDHNISREVEIENIGHGGLEFDNEQDDVLDKVSSPAVEKMEGDAFTIQYEDHDNESNAMEIQHVGHDGPEFDKELDDISDKMDEVKFDNEQDYVSDKVNSHAVEKLEGDAFTIQNEDHNKESKDMEIQHVDHDGSEFDKEADDISDKMDKVKFDNEQEDVSDKVTSHAVEKLEGEAFTIQNEDHDMELKDIEIQHVGHDGSEFDKEPDDISGKMDEVKFSNEQDGVSDKVTSHAVEKLEGEAFTIQNEDHDMELKDIEIQHVGHDGSEFDKEPDDISDKMDEVKFGNEQDDVSDKVNSHAVEKMEGDAFAIQNEDHNKESKDMEIQHVGYDGSEFDKELDDISDKMDEMKDVKLSTREEMIDNMIGESEFAQRVDESMDLQRGPQEENLEASSSIVPGESFHEVLESISLNSEIQANDDRKEYSGANIDNNEDFESKSQEVHLDNNFTHNDMGEENDNTSNEDRNSELVFDGKEVLGVEASQGTLADVLYAEPETPRVVERAVALTNFVRVKSVAVVSTMLRRISGKIGEDSVCNYDDVGKDVSNLHSESEPKDVSKKEVEKATLNPLNQREDQINEGPPKPIAMKGRIILYTRLGCQESKKVRQFLYMKRLRYVEINIDVYPGRKTELENMSGSTSVPKVFFNDILIGGLTELKTLNESGKLDEKIDFLITEPPSFEGPFPPLSGEDDMSSSGALDEMALIARKMKESIVVKDRFSKMRRFTNCFLGSEAVDFLSEDQYLERKEAVEFGRKLASKLFFQHVLDENLFEDGNHLYRFLDDDPIVASQCHNIPRGIITVKPKPITEIASRLRFLSYAMFEAYASEDGRHVDYRSMHGSEEFARYLRVVEELQRVEILNMSREERLAFFINLYNMMTIHAILIWGHPAGALERRKLFGDFKYVISGCTYSLSAIQNGILRGNQRPPYSLMKPFGAKDKRAKVALSFCEPLIHFALVCGTRSGPALRCYSPGEIDKELMDAARNFLRSGGLLIDFTTKVANASKILKWFSVDFGKNEVEVMKHVSIYLDPADLELLLDLLASSELKVTYQPYDWGLNC